MSHARRRDVRMPRTGVQPSAARRRLPGWSDLPDPIVEEILRRAFALDGSSVAAWCRLFLVCKCADTVST